MDEHNRDEPLDIPDFVPDDIEQKPDFVWIHPPDGGLMLITEEEAVAAIEKHGDYGQQFVFFFAELTTDGS
jgi:hypothetical protein